jgi:hypothetical protein
LGKAFWKFEKKRLEDYRHRGVGRYHHQRGVFLVVILVVMGNNIKRGTISG